MSCCSGCTACTKFATGQPGYRLTSMAANVLFASSALDINGAANVPEAQSNVQGKVWAAISVDPSSTLRDVVCYFDGQAVGVPLPMGTVIVRQFSQVQIAPLFPAPQWNGNVGAGWAPATLLCPQTVNLRLWSVRPHFDSFEAPRTLTVMQRNLTSVAVGAVEVLAVHAPMAKFVTFFVTNDNVVNGAPNNITLRSARGEVALGATARLSTAGGTPRGSFSWVAALPAAASFDLVEVAVTNDSLAAGEPSVGNFVALSAAAGGGIALSLTCGMRFTF